MLEQTLLARVGDFIGKIWNSPNSFLGLIFGGVGYIAGAVKGTSPYVSTGYNAIQFHNIPLVLTAMTWGNVIVYGVRYTPDDVNRPFRNSPENHTVGKEEYRHTQQGQILGPLYFPLHIIGGVTSYFRRPHKELSYRVGAWHQNNFMERGPMQDRIF